MNFERLPDFRHDSNSLLAESSSVDPKSYRTGVGVVLGCEGGSAWSGEHTGTTGLSKQLAGSFVARTGTIQEHHGDLLQESLHPRNSRLEQQFTLDNAPCQ